jgi:hypothetical protein
MTCEHNALKNETNCEKCMSIKNIIFWEKVFRDFFCLQYINKCQQKSFKNPQKNLYVIFVTITQTIKKILANIYQPINTKKKTNQQISTNFNW